MPVSDLLLSRVDVEHIRQRSRLTVCESVAPTKLLHPFCSDKTVCVMLSSFGGGMVQGDQVGLHVHCGANASLLLRTQANSRVFKNMDGGKTSLHMIGTVDAGGQVVYLPDPLVMHEGSRLEQMQRWEVSGSANLLVGDWFQSGRSDSGESFRFDHYRSSCELRLDGEMVVWEPVDVSPALENPLLSGRFGGACLSLTLFAVGADMCQLLEDALGTWVSEQKASTQVQPLPEDGSALPASFVCSLVRMEDRPVSIFRALGKTRGDFDPIFLRLNPLLQSPEWLDGGATLLPAPVNTQTNSR